jgi:dTDP-4-amino-4,6-dideoxygalactose transaminase
MADPANSILLENAQVVFLDGEAYSQSFGYDNSPLIEDIRSGMACGNVVVVQGLGTQIKVNNLKEIISAHEGIESLKNNVQVHGIF